MPCYRCFCDKPSIYMYIIYKIARTCYHDHGMDKLIKTTQDGDIEDSRYIK